MSRSRLSQATEVDHAQKLKEAFAILTQGVEMVHYDTVRALKASQRKMKKIVWMDSEILRICVDIRRPSLADRAKGKIPPGIYVRDISEVRSGRNAYDFQASASPPEFDDHCFSLLASERCICLELPSKFARDWFFERLHLIADEILTAPERALRDSTRISSSSSQGSQLSLGTQDVEAATKLHELLERGIQVLHHHPCGKVLDAVLSADASHIHLRPVGRTFFGFPVAKPLRMAIVDVIELRSGTHSFGFVGTKSTDKHHECVSFVGSECTMDIQMVNQTARDLFCIKFRLLVLKHKMNLQLVV